MERLGETYKNSGMIFRLKERTEKKAWYVCRLTGSEIHEVFVIPVYEAGEMFGKMYPQRENRPGNEMFGKTAWCITGRDAEARARISYEALDDLIKEGVQVDPAGESEEEPETDE